MSSHHKENKYSFLIEPIKAKFLDLYKVLQILFFYGNLQMNFDIVQRKYVEHSGQTME